MGFSLQDCLRYSFPRRNPPRHCGVYTPMRLRVFLLLAAAEALAGQTPREWLNQGVRAFKNGQYAAATDAFLKAVNLEPNNATARLYLGTAYMQQYIPGADSPENLAFAQNAETAFQSVLGLEPANDVAIASLASLKLNMKKFEDARGWYQRLVEVNPQSTEAWYSLGFISWARWYPAYQQARRQAGMKPEDPGPLPGAELRADMANRWMPVLAEGISALQHALEINPDYSDAMAYMNLLIRERADLRDSQAEYLRDIAEADGWVQKAMEAKKKQAQQRQGVPPPPPPPLPRG